MSIGEGREKELRAKVEEVMDRYEKVFHVKLSPEGLMSIVEEMFDDNRKNLVKAKLEPITYADHEYLVKLFRTRAIEKQIEEEDAKEVPKERTTVKGRGGFSKSAGKSV